MNINVQSLTGPLRKSRVWAAWKDLNWCQIGKERLKPAPRAPPEVYVGSLGIHASYPIQDKTNKFSPYVPSGISQTSLWAPEFASRIFTNQIKTLQTQHQLETTPQPNYIFFSLWKNYLKNRFSLTSTAFLSGETGVENVYHCSSRLATCHFSWSATNIHFHPVTFFEWALRAKSRTGVKGLTISQRPVSFHWQNTTATNVCAPGIPIINVNLNGPPTGAFNSAPSRCSQYTS